MFGRIALLLFLFWPYFPKYEPPLINSQVPSPPSKEARKVLGFWVQAPYLIDRSIDRRLFFVWPYFPNQKGSGILDARPLIE